MWFCDSNNYAISRVWTMSIERMTSGATNRESRSQSAGCLAKNSRILNVIYHNWPSITVLMAIKHLGVITWLIFWPPVTVLKGTGHRMDRSSGKFPGWLQVFHPYMIEICLYIIESLIEVKILYKIYQWPLYYYSYVQISLLYSSMFSYQ
jgi:hypothetical protein